MAATFIKSINGLPIKDANALKGASVSGKSLTITKGDDTTVTLDASYANATTSAAGLMSAADKELLEGLKTTGGQPNKIEVVKVDGVALTITNKAVDITGKADVATSLSGYGITDAKIEDVASSNDKNITLGSKTARVLTNTSTLDATKLSGTIPSTCYTDTVTTATDSGSGNGVASVTATNGALTVTKATFVVPSEIENLASLSGATFTGTVKAPNPAAELSDDTVATTKFVKDAIGTLSGAMLFKGTIGTSGTVTALPAKHNVGDTYKVITAGTYAGQKCEVGDMIICITDGSTADNAHWTVVQNNIDVMTGASATVAGAAGMVPAPAIANKDQFLRGDGTWATPANTTYSAGTGLSLSGTTFNHSNSVTAATNVGSNTAGAVAFGGSIVIPKISYDAQGHITASGTTTVTLPANPNTDTKVTSVGNHYTPAENAGSALNASTTADASDLSDSAVDVITGLKRDAAGHVTGIVSTKLEATNTTYNDFNGTTHGLVPVCGRTDLPKDTTKANATLMGDATWKVFALNLAVTDAGDATLSLVMQ